MAKTISGGLDLLFLMPEIPFPPRKGTAMRNYNLIRNLAPRHRVRVLGFDGEGVDVRGLEQSGLCERIFSVRAPRRPRWRRLAQLALPTPDLALRLESAPMVQALARVLQTEPPQVVQVEGLEMAPIWLRAVARCSGRRPISVLDEHNAEYALQWRAFCTDRREPKRWGRALYSLVQWAKLRHYERDLLRRFDGVVAVSPDDVGGLRRLLSGLEVIVVSNGVDTDYFRPVDDETARHQSDGVTMPWPALVGSRVTRDLLVFTGTLNYRPNVDAAVWMAERVLPVVRRRCPNAELYLVGQRPLAEVQRLGSLSGVHVIGTVDDVRPYLARASVYVVPMRFGGGVRLKVLEAMAMGKPVVSTSMGVEGIDLVAGKHAVIADTPEDFGLAVASLLADPRRRREMTAAARALVCERYDWRILVAGLEEYYRRLLVAADKRESALPLAQEV